MENLRAKIPHNKMSVTAIHTVRYDQDPETGAVHTWGVKQPKESWKMNWSLTEDLDRWCQSCEGPWRVLVDEWKIEFDLEQDYVSYCLNWL